MPGFGMHRMDRVHPAYGKIIPPFELDETLTFFCPQENLEALGHPRIKESTASC